MSKAVILIPGIKGTKLYDANSFDNDILWQDIRYNFSDFERLELTLLQKGNIPYFEEDFTTIAKPLKLEGLAYNEFWNRLDYEKGHKFIFQYDWRLPNQENAVRLKEFMDYIILKSKKIKNGNPITKFDFVTHSMGNMPLRFYILEHGMDKIDKIIFANPPFKGAPDAISALTVGEGFFFNRDEIRRMARSLPSLFELLPSYNYCAIDSNSYKPVDIWNIKNWQKNLTFTTNPQEEDSIKKFKENLKHAKTAKEKLEKWNNNLTQEEKNRILVLVKTEDTTLSNIVIEKDPIDNNPENYFDLDISLRINEGDGVVPNVSSCHYHDQFTTLAFENRPFLDDFKHPFFLKDNRAQRIINGYLNSKEPAISYKLPVKGRNVKRVIGLKTNIIIENGIDHKFEKIELING